MRNIIAISLIFLISFCREKTYSSYYYILFNHLRSGFNRPEKIQNIQVKYNINLLTLELNWTLSIDPDTKQAVPYYFIYLYYEYPSPKEYYDKKYLLDVTSVPKYSLFTGTFVGTLFFIITAYDLGSESEISEIIKVEIP